jgi:nucleoside-diphosphate-sugar epimerase
MKDDLNSALGEILIVGCGDIGVRVARLVKQQGGAVTALARSCSNEARLGELGLDTVPGDLDDPESLGQLAPRGRILCYFAPPPGGGVIDTRVRTLCQLLDEQGAPCKIVYISTSGVYGDCGGDLVTEGTPLNPQTSRAKRRADAEAHLGRWCEEHTVPLVILRVTGIYGPGRLPLVRLRQGHPVLNEQQSPPTNRIHADDLAAVCLAALGRDVSGVFNVSDGQPGTMTGYFNLLCDLLSLPRPPQVSMAEAKEVMSPMMLSYLSESRRLDNRKMLRELGVSLRYTDFELGLRSVLAELDQPNMGYLGSVPAH